MTRKQTIIAYSNFIFKREDPSPNADLRRLAFLEINGQKVNESSPIVAINFQSAYKYRLNSYLEKQSVIDTNQKPIIDLGTELCTLTKDYNLLAQLKVITTNTEKTGEATDDFNIILTNYPNFNWLNETTGYYSMPGNQQYTATTRPDSRLVSNTQPLFLSTLLNFNEEITNLKVQAMATFADNSDYSFTLTEIVNQTPAGTENPCIITLTTNIANIVSLIDTNTYPNEVKSITCTILADGTGFSNQPISVPQTYHIDYAFYPEEQIIIYKNQIGVYDTLRTTGQLVKDLDRTSESFSNQNVEKELKIKVRNRIAINLGIENADQSQEICEAIATSKNIFLLQNKNLIPLLLSSNNLKPYDSNKQADDQTLEFKYAQIS